MSRLNEIRQALESNHDVLVIREIKKNSLDSGPYHQSIDFLVSPKNALYTIDELENFRRGLIPNSNSSDGYGFAQTSTTLVLGQLGFEEVVAHYRRRIGVTIFPSEDIVKDILQQKIDYNHNSINLRDFKKYIPLSQRISMYMKDVVEHFIPKPNSHS